MLIFVFEMEICEIVKNGLFAIKCHGDDEHSLNEMAKNLTDVDYLYRYFQQNEDKLSYYRGTTINAAVAKTHSEANALLQELLEFAENEDDNENNLDHIFHPLHKTSFYSHPRFYTDYKAKGIEAPWVRIYAVKCDTNLYVISGYGIKLVRQMQDDELLTLELDKLRSATAFLKEIGIL